MPPLGIASPQIGTSRHNPFGLHNFHHNTTTIKESGRHSPLLSASTRGPPGLRAVPDSSKKAHENTLRQRNSHHNTTAIKESGRHSPQLGASTRGLPGPRAVPDCLEKRSKAYSSAQLPSQHNSHQRVGPTQPTARREHARPARPEGSPKPFKKSDQKPAPDLNKIN